MKPIDEMTIAEYAELDDGQRRQVLIGHTSRFAAGVECLAWAVLREDASSPAPIYFLGEAPPVGDA